ncbi:hypothetical protein CS369_01545 [Candidatus Symbiopectobacterium sp. 'North America']|nr:hypothetical protein [Candidatus Symbiopectobacterium sp. 'North America']
MLQYLYENKINSLSQVSFIYGVAFIESLLSILDEMKALDLGIIDINQLLMIRDIYSNKKVNHIITLYIFMKMALMVNY